MRVFHVLRTPVGGLFRHVRDLARGQTALGIECGIVCDAATGGDGARLALEHMAAHCKLGVVRLPMARLPAVQDLALIGQVAAFARRAGATLLHGHGAKGGLYARLAARRLKIPSVYTPHGGSLHYGWTSPAGAAFLAAERYLRGVGTGLLFVCAFERDAFAAKVGLGGKPHAVVHNGLWPEEFLPVLSALEPADVLYLGELRRLKGTDVLIEALAILNRRRPTTAAIVGDGEERATFEHLARGYGLADRIAFMGALPARQAFALGRLFVMPSRAESFPYALLEALAAGLPAIASRVGGIPEILAPECMVPPGRPDALADAIATALDQPRAPAPDIRQRFDAARMAGAIAAFYRSLPGT